MTSQYDNPKLWARVPGTRGKDYVSVAAPVPEAWKRLRYWPGFEVGQVRYVSGEYEIRGRVYGTRKSYTVWRQGAELDLSIASRLKDAKARAVKNANGEDRMHVA
jgi:hypothetical protein